MSSAICFNLDQSKILSSGIELSELYPNLIGLLYHKPTMTWPSGDNFLVQSKVVIRGCGHHVELYVVYSHTCYSKVRVHCLASQGVKVCGEHTLKPSIPR